MKTWQVALIAALLCAAAHADAPPGVTGIWEGVCALRGDAPQPMVMKVVEEPGGLLWAILDMGGETGRLSGCTEGTAAVLVGSVTPGGREERWLVLADIDAGKLQGRMRPYEKPDDPAVAFTLHRVIRDAPDAGRPPPPGAVVLFDGSGLDAWDIIPGNMTDGGSMRVNGNYFSSKATFGDARIHVEFRTPHVPYLPSDTRGNSGVYVQGRYELQILDSFAADPAPNGCGAVYLVAAPVKQPCLPPGSWQTFDITFQAPRFTKDGVKSANARISVRMNGVMVHDDLELPGITPGWVFPDEAPGGPLVLQHHESEVQFRNIWVVPAKTEGQP